MGEKDSKKKGWVTKYRFHMLNLFHEKACRQLHWISELYTQLLLGQNPSLLSQGPRWLQDKSRHTYIVLREMETGWMRLKVRMNEWMNLSHFAPDWISMNIFSWNLVWHEMKDERNRERSRNKVTKERRCEAASWGKYAKIVIKPANGSKKSRWRVKGGSFSKVGGA